MKVMSTARRTALNEAIADSQQSIDNYTALRDDLIANPQPVTYVAYTGALDCPVWVRYNDGCTDVLPNISLRDATHVRDLWDAEQLAYRVKNGNGVRASVVSYHEAIDVEIVNYTKARDMFRRMLEG